jgi:hypothetical protein
MATNDMGIPSAPKVGSDRWWQEIHNHRRTLLEAERTSPTWVPISSDDYWWAYYFQVRQDEGLAWFDGLILPPTKYNAIERLRF